MAINSVKLTLNGQDYLLTYDSASGKYKATVTAPAVSSWNAESDHKYHGVVTAEDVAGNEAVATVSDFAALGLRVLEKVAPLIGVTYPSDGAFIINPAPTIQWTVTDSGSGIDASTISIKIDSGSVITAGITKTAITGGYACEYTAPTALSDGAHTLTFYAEDNDGNSAAATSSSFTVDTVPPTLNITAPADGLITNAEDCVVAGSTNDATSGSVVVTVNGSPVTVTDGEFSTTIRLAEGVNTITVIATDAAGQTSTVVRTVVLDTVAPIITAVTIAPNPVDAGATYVIEVTVAD